MAVMMQLDVLPRGPAFDVTFALPRAEGPSPPQSIERSKTRVPVGLPCKKSKTDNFRRLIPLRDSERVRMSPIQSFAGVPGV